MSEVVINSFTKCSVDHTTKTIVLSREHLGEANIRKAWGRAYDIIYKDVKKYIQNELDAVYIKAGYKVVFEHKGQRVLLIYNK